MFKKKTKQIKLYKCIFCHRKAGDESVGPTCPACGAPLIKIKIKRVKRA